MFLKSLQIENVSGLIRNIRFLPGLNLIVDETPSDADGSTGNNVGKTTVLTLIDYCLGASAKVIFTDPETKKTEYTLVKEFLVDTQVLVTLTLTEDLDDLMAKELVIERNFLPRSKHIRRINSKQLTEEEFEKSLTNMLFPNHYGNKPTFSQIISHNVRYKELSVTNTLRTLSSFTRDDEYETLYLFLLGCSFDQGNAKQSLLAQIRLESTFKARLESQQTKSAYEASLALLTADIEKLNERKSSLRINPEFESDLDRLNEVKHQINIYSAFVSRLKLRQSLVVEATREIKAGHAAIDIDQLQSLYADASGQLSKVQRSFEELVDFHNRMVEEKARFVSKELPALEAEIEANDRTLVEYLKQERELADKVTKSDSFEELELLVSLLNEKHRLKGEFEQVIRQIAETESNLRYLNLSLSQIDDELFSSEFEAQVQRQLNKLNKHFSAISDELYGEKYALKFVVQTNKRGQRVYQFSSFNTNFSSGKKQGEIVCFDIAYTLFADEEGIPCFHFLLNDKKELMHDNQLTKIAHLVERQKKHVQFVASILKDKLPPQLNKAEHFVVTLSQKEKLFRIESDG